MKPGLNTSLAALALMALLGAPSSSAELDFELSAHSHYVWRGITTTDGPVFQPSMTGTVGRFSANVWANLELDDATDRPGEFTEIDFTLDYAVISEGAVTLNLGLIEYAFPESRFAGTREFYASLGFGSVVSPVLNIYYDFDEVDDLYANFGISLGKDITDEWSWALSLTAGYAGEDFARELAGGTDSGLFDGVARLDIGYESGALAFGAYVAWIENLDSNALPDQAVDLIGGVSVGWSFD